MTQTTTKPLSANHRLQVVLDKLILEKSNKPSDTNPQGLTQRQLLDFILAELNKMLCAYEQLKPLINNKESELFNQLIFTELLQTGELADSQTIAEVLNALNAKKSLKLGKLSKHKKRAYLMISLISLILSIGNAVMLYVGLTSEIIEPLSVILTNLLGFIAIHFGALSLQWLFTRANAETDSAWLAPILQGLTLTITCLLAASSLAIAGAFFSTTGLMLFGLVAFMLLGTQSMFISDVRKTVKEENHIKEHFDTLTAGIKRLCNLFDPKAKANTTESRAHEDVEMDTESADIEKRHDLLFFKHNDRSPSLKEEIANAYFATPG